MLSEADIVRDAALTGFRKEILEKVYHLLEMLELLCRHPFLKSRVVLKGGTALNLFIHEVPRLSVDIDLNYIGATDRKTMLAERPKVEQAIQGVCKRLRVTVKRMPDDHAGGKWRMSYVGTGGRTGALELDLNFMHRTPLWAHQLVDSRRVGSKVSTNIPVLDFHDLASGKLAALFSRNASRDLFDAREMLRRDDLDWDKLRLGFVVYGGMARRDWREVSLDDVAADIQEVDRMLVPMLRDGVTPKRKEIQSWTNRLVAECREQLAPLLPLSIEEIAFLSALNDRGEVKPELLTADDALKQRISAHPGLLWKALNVKKHFGTTNQGDS